MIKTITLKFKSVKNEDILMVIKRTVMIINDNYNNNIQIGKIE